MEHVTALPPIPRRLPDTHKGTYGRVLIAAGSPGMPGAPVLCARAALRAGSGLVTVAAPASISPVIGAGIPEATQVLLPEPGSLDYRTRIAEALGTRLDARFDVLAAGPGLTTSESAQVLLEALLADFSGPQVLDADALNILAAQPALETSLKGDRVWTPHPGELSRLTGEKPEGDEARVAAAASLARTRGGVVVLKGHRTVVVEGERYHISDTGNPGMATGGSGDVLTGIIASLIGQGFPPFEAACLGVRLHGAAGDLAARDLGEHSILASDIIERLPGAFRRYGES